MSITSFSFSSLSQEKIISSLLGIVDQIGAEFVSGTYQKLVNNFSNTAYILATLYLGMVFLKMKRNQINVAELPFIILRMVMILTLALNYHYFCLYIYNVFTKMPLYVCQSLTLKSGSVSLTTVGSALDNFLNQGLISTNKIFAMGGWSNPSAIFFGGAFFIIVMLTACIATGLFMLAKIAMIVLLALSPLFIFFALYDATKGWFEAYIRQLATYAFIPVMTSAVLMILLSVMDFAINYMNQGDKPTLKLIIPFALVCMVELWLLCQIKPKCESLMGGFALQPMGSSIVAMGRDARNALNTLTGGNVGRGIASYSAALPVALGAKAFYAARAMKNRNLRFNQKTGDRTHYEKNHE